MRSQKRHFSLSILEVMIVILLISIIGGTIGYNLKGSLDKGKSFKTEQAKEQLRDLLLLYAAEKNVSLKEAIRNPLENLQKMDLAKNPKELLQDGWGDPFEIKVESSGSDFKITSKKYDKYHKDHAKQKEEDSQDE